MDTIKLLEAVSAAMVPLATCFLMIPKRFGFWILNVANILCAIVFVDKHLWYYLLQVIVLFGLNFVGIYLWKRRKIG
jgi:nicotinamide riboside transporter PnuC